MKLRNENIDLSTASVRFLRAETRLTVHRSLYIRMLSQLVGLRSVERANVTRTEGIAVRVIRMLVQPVNDFSVERTSVLFTTKYVVEINIEMRLPLNYEDTDYSYKRASLGAIQ